VSAREIARIAFGRFRKGVLVCLTAYFDKAGDESGYPVITVGGFFADAELCEAIESDWEAATGKRVFHLADFGTPYCELGSGDWTANERIEFLKKLASIVNRTGCSIVTASIEVQPYNEFLAGSSNAHAHGPAFSGCAQAAIAHIEFLLMKQKRRNEKVRYVFEKGDRQHEIVKLIDDWERTEGDLAKLRGYGFEPKETTLLQPADLISGIVQGCVLSAHKAISCLDNGFSRTPLHNFASHYSNNGVTLAVVKGNDQQNCWVYNQLTFKVVDRDSTNFYARYPKIFERRMKQSPFKPKVKNEN
jgi:hypothetical protein